MFDLWFLLMIFFFLSVFFMMLFMIFMFLLFLLLDEKIYVLEILILNFNFLMEIKLFFYFDFISILFISVISLISSMVFYFSSYYMDSDKNKAKFIFLTFLFVISMFIVVLSLNFYMILLGWDGLGIVSYFLIIHYQTSQSDYSGIFTIMTNRLGDIGMIFSIYFMFDYCSFDIIIMNELAMFMNLFILFFVMGALTKSAQFPFSSWLPLAMAAPTPISSLVHSSTLVTAGVYLFIRFNFLFYFNSLIIMFMLCLAGLTMLVSGLSALSELDVKKIIALSTLSQLGLMMMIVLMGNEMLGFFHILTHALFKALLFMCSGVFIHENSDNQDIRNYCQILKLNKLVSLVFLISSLSLSGFPFLSGFYSKDLILELMYSINFNLFYLIMLMILTMITVVYSMRLLYFSVIMGKSSILIFIKNWDNIYNCLFFLLLGVIFSGSILSWVILEKLNLFFITSMVKILNLIYIYWGVVFYMKMNINFISSFMNYFNSLFYLNSFQGILINKFLKNLNYFYYFNEFYMEYLFVFSFNNFLNNFMMIKLINYYFFLNSLLFMLTFLFIYY